MSVQAGTRRRRGAIVALVLVVVATLGTTGVATALPNGREAEAMRVPGSAGRIVTLAGASNRRALLLTGSRAARTRLAAPSPSALTIAVRARRCRGAPRIVASVDGRAVIRRPVGSRRWTMLRSRSVAPAGAHRVRIRLANPRRARGCRRGLLLDRVSFVARAAGPPTSSSPGATLWRPASGTTWQWQLSGALDTSVAVQVYDIDLFDNDASVVAALHAQGRRVVCYFSAGSHEPGRPDSGDFPAAVLGSALQGWPDERWLDIRRLDLLGPIMERRLDLCRQRGFDGVEADNVDGYSNGTGFPLTAADQLAYNRFLARAAHARGLSIGLKNDLAQVAELEPDFDFAVNEECFAFSECDLLAPFVRAGKAVLNVEYDLDTASFCADARRRGFSSMRKNLALDAFREPC
jgi:hypothetical protein